LKKLRSLILEEKNLNKQNNDFLDENNSIFRSQDIDETDEFKDFEDDSINALKERIESLQKEDETEEESIPKEAQEIDDEDKAEIEHTLDDWQEVDDNDCVVKKYIVYVSKDYVPYIDNLTLDERSAYINDALEKKVQFEAEKKQKQNKKRLLKHLLVSIIVLCLCTPFMLIVAHKAIMATFNNYKYSQDNFEKLYRSKFEKDRAYQRSVEYNRKAKMKLENR